MFQMEPYHIVLADDHLMFRQGIKKILEEHDDLKIVGEANDGLELLNLLKKITPHVVILDISMPNIRGIEATKEIKMTAPEINIVILTMHKSKEYLYHCLEAGAQGYLLKEDADTELYTAIKKVIEGGYYISPILSEALKDDFVQICLGNKKLVPERLTSREREVTKLIAEGNINKEIANLLFISIRTVENHRANIMKKLKLRNTSELVRYAIRKKYVSINI
jgi:DNA-binding NarL/FixJ family response regulator